MGLPNNVRYDAGDVSADGTTMYVNQAGNSPLWVIDLTTSPAMAASVALSADLGTVNDWAFNPDDGNLYGGSQDGNEIIQVDPGTGDVTSFSVPGLPGGIAYGGAWFDATGNLFVYRNSDPADGVDCNNMVTDESGTVYEIALDLMAETGMIVNQQTAPLTEGRNDGAACIPMPPFIGAAKIMTANPTEDVPSTITIEYVFENFGTTSPADDMTALSAMDNLEFVFGTAGVDWTLTSVNSTPMDLFHNPGFDGEAMGDIQLINQTPPNNDLAAGDVKTITIVIELLTLANGIETPPGSGTFQFCNQVNVQALNNLGELIGDISFGGMDPDPDMNDIPSEEEASCLQFTPPVGTPEIDLVKSGTLDLGGDGVLNAGDVVDYEFQVTNVGDVTLFDISVTDPLVSPIDCNGDDTPPQIASLDPLASVTCTGSYVLTQDDIDDPAMEICNTANANGMDGAGTQTMDVDTFCLDLGQEPCIDLIKTGALNLGDDGIIDPGDLIEYEFEVTNCGNVTLTNVTVSDPLVAPITCPPGNPIPSMAPGDMETCMGSYAITLDDIDNGERCNTATAEGTTPPGGTVDDTDDHCEPLEEGVPGIPTLGHFGLLLLGLGLAGLGVRRLRRGD
jgi:uncharacterized repeat protein (TIGR01451 family)